MRSVYAGRDIVNVLELFAGSRSIGRVAEAAGCRVFSVDWEPFENIDLVVDISKMTPDMVPFVPDFIWASPDCSTYSVAGIFRHRDGPTPRSDKAKMSDQVNIKLLELIDLYCKINPKVLFYIENPRGMLRKMPFMRRLDRATVWYCKYGDDRAKPTDIWTNNLYTMFNRTGWEPRPLCWNGNTECHHQSAPRGSLSGTQGRNGHYERAKIPEQLCQEIIQNALEISR